jgi:FixJ family two-component response regulator/glycine cleavage system H lipoate-binding protein
MAEDQRLLVVDDEEAICEGCRRIFARQGFQVEKTSDARAGLRLASENDYAAILLDIKMPEMTGIEFLAELREKKPNVPVILMTGYPSIPNAISAVRLGAAGYVTKPFTPEEISQAVHEHVPNLPERAAAAAQSEHWVPAAEGFSFFQNAWVQPGNDGTARVGAMVTRSQAEGLRAVRLPKLGEVVFQGLPLAALVRDVEPPVILPAPVSGVVVAVNESLTTANSAAAVNGQWVAALSPTRLEEELNQCTRRRVILLNADEKSAAAEQAKLAALGCHVRLVERWEDLSSPVCDKSFAAVLVDAASVGTEGPTLVARINAAAPAIKIVLLAQADCPLEAAYRAHRIFYYAVDALADNEIADVLESVFRGPESAPAKKTPVASSANVAAIQLVNRNGTKVRLMPAPGLIHRDEGLGLTIRRKLIDRLFPVETLLGDSPIQPATITKAATTCDRLVVLMAKDVSRLPGSLVRDTKAEFVSVAGEDAGNVTTLVVQPDATGALNIGDGLMSALAEHIVNDLASY